MLELTQKSYLTDEEFEKYKDILKKLALIQKITFKICTNHLLKWEHTINKM